MPIYEYECLKCGAIQEAIQKFSDRPLTKCNKCGGKLKKMISNSSFVLKGTGWYKTDYASKSCQSEKKPATKPEAKKDAKPVAKAEPAAKAE